MQFLLSWLLGGILGLVAVVWFSGFCGGVGWLEVLEECL